MDVPLSTICPISLRMPVAPAAAAAAEGAALSLTILRQHFISAACQGSVVLVEAAGGLLSPYTSTVTGADLAAAFELPVLLIARNCLGTINHTALAVAEILRRQLPFLGIVLVNVAETPSPDQSSNAALIASITGVQPLGVLPHLSEPTTDSLARQMESAIDLSPIWASLST
jgi:dethiobiotin synthetase